MAVLSLVGRHGGHVDEEQDTDNELTSYCPSLISDIRKIISKWNAHVTREDKRVFKVKVYFLNPSVVGRQCSSTYILTNMRAGNKSLTS